MYSYKDTKRIYNLSKTNNKIKEKYRELSDISNVLNSILFRTAFFSEYIDDKTSYISINYIIDLLKSIDKEELKLVDHHLIDTFTYPYIHQNERVINGLKTIFKSNEVDDTYTYISNFTRIFVRLCAIHAAGIDICKYRKLDVLVDIFSNYMQNSPIKREYYALLQLIVAYLYQNIDNYDSKMINYIFESLFKDEYYLSKIKLNTFFPLNDVIDTFREDYNKDDLLYTYEMANNIVNSILNDKELSHIKKVIM